MSEVIDKFYSDNAKYEVVESDGSGVSSPQYYIYKDGEQISGGYDNLSDAIDDAKEKSGN